MKPGTSALSRNFKRPRSSTSRASRKPQTPNPIPSNPKPHTLKPQPPNPIPQNPKPQTPNPDPQPIPPPPGIRKQRRRPLQGVRARLLLAARVGGMHRVPCQHRIAEGERGRHELHVPCRVHWPGRDGLHSLPPGVLQGGHWYSHNPLSQPSTLYSKRQP